MSTYALQNSKRKQFINNEDQTKETYYFPSSFILNFIFDDYIVDQDGKGQGSEENGQEHCLHSFSFLFPVSGGGEVTTGETMPSFSTTRVPRGRDQSPVSSQGPQSGALSEGSAPVGSVVLRCCWYRCSKGEEILPRSIG